MPSRRPFLQAAALVSSLWLASLYLLVRGGYLALQFGGEPSTSVALDAGDEEEITVGNGTKWGPIEFTSVPYGAPADLRVTTDAVPMPPTDALPKDDGAPARQALMAGTKSYVGAVTLQADAALYQPPASAEPVTVQPNGFFQTPLAPKAGFAPSLPPRQQLMMSTKSAPVSPSYSDLIPPSTESIYPPEPPRTVISPTTHAPTAANRPQALPLPHERRPNAPIQQPIYPLPPYQTSNEPANSSYVPQYPPTYTPPPLPRPLPQTVPTSTATTH